MNTNSTDDDDFKISNCDVILGIVWTLVFWYATSSFLLGFPIAFQIMVIVKAPSEVLRAIMILGLAGILMVMTMQTEKKINDARLEPCDPSCEICRERAHAAGIWE